VLRELGLEAGHASLIDLHLHTTASDGTLAPRDLVARAASAHLSTIAVTDHDTLAGIPEARTAADAVGITLVPGIEITAVESGVDVHVLGYFFDTESGPLAAFLSAQRLDRIRRVREMCDRLSAIGCQLDAQALIDLASGGSERSIGRPAIADALVRAGHARDRNDAFDRLIGRDAPAYVPREGVPVATVVRMISDAGGIASLAHPVLAGIDSQIPSLAAAGLAALEVRHADHSPEVERHYRRMASHLGLAVSGGSDFHGDDSSNSAALGRVTLSHDDFELLSARIPRRQRFG
jgi:3',5'-nucleoside bisphosphate phosphatase